MAARFFLVFGIDLRDEDFFPVAGGFLKHPAEGVADKGVAEEFDAIAGRAGNFLKADAVRLAPQGKRRIRRGPMCGMGNHPALPRHRQRRVRSQPEPRRL